MRLESGLALAFLGVACLYEWRQRRVPNWLALPALSLVAGWRFWSGESGVFLASSVLFVAAWRSGLIGGGDAKVLMALVAVWPTWAYLVWLGGGMTMVYGLLILARRDVIAEQEDTQDDFLKHQASNNVANRKQPLLLAVMVITLLFAASTYVPK